MEAEYKTYKPSWKSYCGNYLVMLLLVAAAGFAQWLHPEGKWIRWMWLAVIAVDVVILLYVAIKRSTQRLMLRDNPAKAEDQEVSFVVYNPMKPLSGRFKESTEIGLSNIVHIKVEQTMMQSMLNVGDIIITSSGTGSEEIRAEDIANPQGVRDEIQVHARRYSQPTQPIA